MCIRMIERNGMQTWQWWQVERQKESTYDCMTTDIEREREREITHEICHQMNKVFRMNYYLCVVMQLNA